MTTCWDAYGKKARDPPSEHPIMTVRRQSQSSGLAVSALAVGLQRPQPASRGDGGQRSLQATVKKAEWLSPQSHSSYDNGLKPPSDKTRLKLEAGSCRQR